MRERQRPPREELPGRQTPPRAKLIEIYLGYMKGWLCKKERLGKIIPGLEI